ncbi:MAG: GPI mannosyltransferase 1 [Candelina mexicana]|nr:MAG: GPI mannosyltransferase 1 [Candelina mexicana]
MNPKPPTSTITRLLSSPPLVLSLSALLRALLFFYGLYQDAHSPLKYTDIDYYVFTDAARYVSRSRSPYDRATYRYTPLLAWLLLPTAWPGQWWFSFGKLVFMLADIIAGWLIYLILRMGRRDGGMGMDKGRAIKYASLWLLNPMVAAISTRGSSESLLAVMVLGLLWAVLKRRVWLAGGLLGLSVHFKIYPFIYGASIMWYLDDSRSWVGWKKRGLIPFDWIDRFMNPARKVLIRYGFPFLQHTYLHHLTRIDHRHNFSPYNTLLYLNSARSSTTSNTTISSPTTTTTIPTHLHLESLAFIPQLALSVILIPIRLSKISLPSTMLAQTFAFVTFNKVCTSQYFIWYLTLLPFYLPTSTFLSNPRLGLLATTLWTTTQAIWLQQAYELEFLGRSTFVPGLWGAALAFFAVNCWILGVVVGDVRMSKGRGGSGRGR